MEMQWFEKWAVNSFSGLYLRWYLLPRLFALMENPLKGTGGRPALPGARSSRGCPIYQP